ncbi:methylated-DNA--[protein]-cysteine S-methyltransferase [Oryzibacter oryziterrae]|uniref:methylated-DNA--[protein]-cysteine S-methyltransferase n=1 Tax=Oryzibacter oryziterrae TaxID=2766474 RepID=UPI001F008E41|nr:methylated-DNA--[protein]-cysteine S-methyltransferase [Oryzibacter oryziterrae]
MRTTLYTYLQSPIGPLLLAGEGERLSHVGFPQGKGRIAPRDDWQRDDGAFSEARAQLTDYFGGKRRTFELALQPSGTAFQLAVWQALKDIPWGTTISYGELARRIGRPDASRAVGAANGANPIPIIVPCHRVIGANGSLTGFGGGIETKKFLLALEGAAGTQPDLF